MMALAAPFITHWALATGRHGRLAAGFAAIQVAVIGGVAVRQTRQRWWAMPLLLLSAGLLVARVVIPALAGGSGRAEPGLIAASALSHATLYVSLLALFGNSLRAGRTPSVTALARRLRGTLSPAVESYTRGVTWLWCGYYGAQLAVSGALLLWAPVQLWSLFINVLDAPLLLVVFFAEFAFRVWRLPHERHLSPLAIMRTFNRASAPADAR